MKSSIPRLGAIPPNVRIGISLGEAQAQRGYSRSDWKPKEFKRGKPKKKHKRYNKEAVVDVFNEFEKFLIIVELPYHTDKDIECDIDNNILTIKSNLFGFNFTEDFKLPENVLTDSLDKSFNNGIFRISFNKRV
uniref:SHSP domain-containing protein n=1 Tax=viral metagenome TaxID=1070528 RepID=A0A6M3JJR8_9ZZZZ